MTSEGVVAKAEMLIRSPVSKVFEAFVDPAIVAHMADLMAWAVTLAHGADVR